MLAVVVEQDIQAQQEVAVLEAEEMVLEFRLL
jgi:hypothetical protein